MLSPKPTSSTLVNTVSFETQFGFRTINLIYGDVLNSRDDLLVVSSHSIAGTRPWGEVIGMLESEYGLKFDEPSPLVAFTATSGTFEVDPLESGWKNVLVVRLPGAMLDSDVPEMPDSEYRRRVWSLFGSIAALEIRGDQYRSMAMPVLGGARGFDIRFLADCLLSSATKWLLLSHHMNTVNAYVADEVTADHWNQGIETLLGRTVVSTTKDVATRALRDELITDLESPDFGFDEQLLEVSREIVSRLRAKKISLQMLALEARRLTERIVQIICSRLGFSVDKSLEGNINRIAKSQKVAPWIASHFHTLRILGNERAHVKEGVLYIPEKLEDGDLLVLLVALSRIAAFWRNRERIHDRAGVVQIGESDPGSLGVS